MSENRACIRALDYLDKSHVRPISECFPSESASFYIPIQKIKALFEDKLEGLTIEHLFLCPCPRCTQDGGSVEDRAICFDQQKLREKYSLIYALLVYIRRPGLIQKFQKYRLILEGTRYLRDEDFNNIRRHETILDIDYVQERILANQYSFLVRKLEPARYVTFISRQELLPIKEDAEAKGEGTFAQVRCFEFQYDDYRSRLFGENVRRFARKIFKPGMNKSAAREWYNLQWLSKEENHPNLMAAFGAYEHGNYFFILQEEAERSLHDYLTRSSDEFDSQELWEQMKGIADGLSTLHKLFKGTKAAYHRDLKPANILILRRKLKIADFGLLEFKPVTVPGDTELTGIPNDHNTGNYAAPRQGRYTRDCDIWSLGCIMSEVATCDIQGQEGVRDYRMARMANGALGRDTPRFYSGTRVKSAVLHRHSQLYECVQTETLAAGNSATYFRKKFYCKEFFELLERMLRHGRLPNNLLETSSEGAGPDAANVVATLETLRKDALPEMVPDDQIENPALEHFLQDTELFSIEFSQGETLVGQEEPTIMLKKQDVEVDDDISIASHTTTGHERLGKAYIARFLADDGEMHKLCSRVLDKVGQEEFVDIGRRMLKDFHRGLLEHAKTELEKEGARLMKSQAGRRRICKDIANIIKSEKTQNEEDKARAAERLRLTEQRLEMFAKDVSDTCADSDPNRPGEDEGELSNDYDIFGLGGQEVFPDSGLESEVEGEVDDLPKLTKVKEFFKESEPFQVLLNDLRMELLPQSLRDVVQTALPDSLLLSNRHDDSLSNRMKAFIEDFTMLKWNWWPLEPRKKRLNSNELRLFWHCSCGTQLWQEISLDDADLIMPMVVNRPASLGLQRRKQNRGLNSLVAKLMTLAAPGSAAGRKYTPSNITQTSNGAISGSQGTGGRSGSNNSLDPTQATNQAADSGTKLNNAQQATSSDLRILFGVKGPNPALKLEQIEITDTMNDSNFYDELQKHYRLNRGRLRCWFSFWRLGYCEVVKFQRYTPDYVLSEGKELPTGDDYEYSPRPPDKAPNPPVSQHEFSMHLNACGDCCRWTSFTKYVPVLGSLLHSCLPRLSTARAIKRIPKKKSPFNTSSGDDSDAYAWGLEAGHEISAAYVAFYHFVILAFPFSFWGWWQATHPGDLQNASVPVTVVLTMLSLFWGTNGILTQGRGSTVTGI